MNFRLTTLMYLFALVAASLSAFGACGGVLAVIGVVSFWALLFYLPRPQFATLFVLGVIVLILIALMVPAVATTRPPPRHAICLHSMRELTTAIIHFQIDHGYLPGTGQPDATNPPHSWRVATLPQVGRQDLFDLYHFDEPWNGPQNSKLVGKSPVDSYECRSHSIPGETNYFAVTGSQSAWGNGERRRLKDVIDGPHNTILLIEAAGRGVHWAEPKDLTFDEAVKLLTTPLPRDDIDGHRVEHGYFYKPDYVRNVTMCDGSAHGLRVPLSREAAVALLTAQGGEEIDPAWLEYQSKPELDYGRVWGFSLFVVLALLPGVPWLRPWIWPVSTQQRQQATAIEHFEAEHRGGE